MRTVRIVIGIDPGTRCGWSIVADGKLLASGVWNLAPKRHEGGGMRYLYARTSLGKLMDSYPGYDFAVYYELVRRHKGTDAAQIYGGIVGAVTALCEERRVPYEGIPVGDIKKFATGKGNADKDAMIEAARKRGYTPADDNEADAIFIGLAGAAILAQ